MNRIVLIGNGFDLAHGLPTRYEDFIRLFWNNFSEQLTRCNKFIYRTPLVDFGYINISPELHLYSRGLSNDLFNYITPTFYSAQDIENFISKNNYCNVTLNFKSKLFQNINHNIVKYKWVDIENEYYNLLLEIVANKFHSKAEELNNELKLIQDMLIKYLDNIDNKSITNKAILDMIYSPFNATDISVKAQSILNEHIEYWISQDKAIWNYRLCNFNLDNTFLLNDILEYKNNCTVSEIITDATYNLEQARPFLLPNNILLLNFNYTQTPELYLYNKSKIAKINYIHGRLSNPESIIFGYGDELDDKYNDIKKLNNNEYLRHFKSSKYLESDNYRQLLQFIESEPYQIYIMGHSCGNSDRTLLNTLFEHDNCVSIKPYYHQKDDGTDDYLDKIQNISRNFTDMKKMRDRVVNKTYCEPLPQLKQ